MKTPEWRAAAFFEKNGEALTCTLCPFGCTLESGARGRCHVRRRHGDALETATMASSVFHVQSIERKPLYHVRPGRRVLTVAAPGCTFSCSYCQNFSLSQYGRTKEAPWSAEPVSAGGLVEMAAREGADLAFSYTEPVLAAELTLEAAELGRAAGVACLWKTNGFVTKNAARLVAPALLAANVDLKAPTESAHEKLTRAPLSPVLEAMSIWKEAGVWLEISTPLIPGFNTDDDSLRKMARLVRALGPETPFHLLRFHPDHREQAAPPTHPTLLRRAANIAREEGLLYVYVERAMGEDGRNTVCPDCKAVVIRRDPWVLLENTLAAGKCRQCGGKIAGIFGEEATS